MKTLLSSLPAAALLCALLFASATAQTSNQEKGDSPDPSPAAQATRGPTQAPSQTAKPTQQSAPDKSKGDQGDNQGTSNDRLFYALPNFLTWENRKDVPPLTTKENFKVVARTSFDYVQVPGYAFLAGVSQAEDSEQKFGQGAEGYGKRFGAYFADGTIENLMTGAILPSVLKQDPRYFQLGQGSFTHRTGYAISPILVTRSDDRRQVFNYSEVLGSALAAGISTYSYHPHGDRTFLNTWSVWGTQVGYDTITLVVNEFWPDIRRKISKNKKPPRCVIASPV